MKIHCIFRYIDEDKPKDKIIEQYVGIITIVSNSNNLSNPRKGLRYHRKSSAAKV